MDGVLVEKTGHGQAVAIVDGARFEARFDATLRRWRVQTAQGEAFSTSAKLHSIGKLFGTPRAAVAGALPPELPPLVVIENPEAHRQARRILASMQEFGFDRGGAWQVPDGAEALDYGWSPRVAGDPIFHTIGQVSGATATREETIEAIAAVVDGRRPALPPRMWPMPAAVKAIAEALAEGRRSVVTEAGRTKIEGPMLPQNWDVMITLPDDVETIQ